MATMVNLSVVVPSNNENGKIWVRPDIGQAYMYINGEWRPFAGGNPISFQIPFTVMIKGEDITDHCYINSFRKVDAITNEVDTLSFKMIDRTGTSKPLEGEEITVFYQPDLATTPVVWFSGEVSTCTPVELVSGYRKFDYEIYCVDWKKRFSKNLVIETYENKTTGYIIADLLSRYAHEFTGYNVKSGKTIDKITFNYEAFNKCIERLAEIDYFDWYIDDEKDMHYFDSGVQYAPYQLVETDATGDYKNLKIKGDASQLRNVVNVRGGVYLSTVYNDDIQEAIDGQLVFGLKYKPHNPVTVYVSTDGGANWVLKTLGIDNISTAGAEFVVNYNDKLIKCLDHAALSAGHLLKCTYKYEIQVLTSDRDDNSIEERKAIEGGDGIHEYSISDPSLETLNAAHDRALADLQEYAYVKISGSYETGQDGYRSGQTLVLNLPTWGYTGEYLIQKVSSQLREHNKLWYTISFATKKKDLKDFLVKLNDRVKPFVTSWNGESQETLHDLARLVAEEIAVTEAAPTYMHEFALPHVYDTALYGYSQYQ